MTTPLILTVTERAHSPLSPSSFERISACTKSYQLTAAAPPGRRRVAGPDAIAGTAAHRLLEHALRGGRPADVEAVRVEGQRIEVDEPMRDAVETALAWCRANLAGRRILVEHPVRLPWGKVAGWLDLATADAPWIVVDFKFGYGVVPADTPQLGLYLLGLILERAGSVEGPGEALAVVIQPRAPAEAVRTHVWTYEQLRELRVRLIATLDRLRREDFTYSVGPHCRWCPAAGVCPALAATARDSVAAKLAAPELVASGEFGRSQLEAALELSGPLDHWVRQTHEVAEAYLLAGGKLKNLKLVAKRTGGLTVVNRSDPRPEIDVSATLKAALTASVAQGHLTTAQKSVPQKPELVR